MCYWHYMYDRDGNQKFPGPNKIPKSAVQGSAFRVTCWGLVGNKGICYMEIRKGCFSLVP